ncbi:UDP-N-acetylmuramoyl-L-alanine--D-glutamate ligase [Cytobacillus sp. Hm23]
MKNTERFRDKKILVLGLAKSGLSAAKLLIELCAEVTINDKKPYEENENTKNLINLGVDIICGSHPVDLLEENFDLIVKNPGIPYTNPIVVEALKKDIPIITEVELAYSISEAEFIGITGSNGKTTTTTLIYDIMKQAQKNPLIAGNIGTVASDVAQLATNEQMIVTELSSFQLQGVDQFRPKISVILNIFDAHLDYHGSKEAYVKAKAKIFQQQTPKDFVVLNADDNILVELSKAAQAKKVFFSTKQNLRTGAYVNNHTIFFNDEEIISTDEIVLPGEHSLENILAAVAVCKLLNITNDAIGDVLKRFSGVKHRLQYVKTYHGRKFYNDSKATNILATQKALNAFSEPIILLAGGLDRGNHFKDLVPYLQNVKTLVTFGQTAELLKEAGVEAGIKNIVRVDNVDKAVSIAYDNSDKGDIILLSPACASWDQYTTFEERGDIFIDAVHMLN